MNMETNLLQRARDIAADVFIRLEMKRPTASRTAQEWADVVSDFAQFTREGAYDNDRDVQIALAALREADWNRAKRIAADNGGKA